MNFTLLEKIGAIMLAPILAISGWFSAPEKVEAPEQVPQQVVGAFNTVAGKVYFLNSPISSSDTSITLSSFKTPVSEYLLVMGNFGSIGYVTIEPGSSARQEIVSFSGITQNSDGTATLTGVTRGLSPVSPFTASTTIQKAHPGGSQVVISNPPQLYEQFATLANNETVTGQYTFTGTSPILYDAAFAVGTSSLQVPFASWVNSNFVDAFLTETIAGNKTLTGNTALNGGTTTSAQGFTLAYSIDSGSDALDVVNKGYVDDLVLAGAPDANQTTKGVVEEATVAEINSKSSTGGTAAKLFMTPAAFSVSRLASSTTYFATSSSAANLYILNVPMLGGDVMKVWSSITAQCNGSDNTLKVRPDNYVASTTLFDTRCAGNNNPTPLSLIGSWTATTTSSVHVGLESSSVNNTYWSSLMVEVIGHP